MRRRPQRLEKMPSRTRSEKEKDRVNRRRILEMLTGYSLAGGATAAAFGGRELFLRRFGESNTAKSFPEARMTPELRARLERIEDAPLFREQVQKFIEMYSGAELELALDEEHGRARTLDDPQGRSRIDYVQDEIMKGVQDIPEAVRTELSFYAPGMFAVESKYQNTLVSRQGAQFVVQGVPDTYALYGYTPEQMRLLKTQVEFARRYFIDMYKMLEQDAGASLQTIQEAYFTDAERFEKEFEKEFVALCIVNAYKAGIGNMIQVVNKFAELEPQPSFRGYDVFEAMTQVAKDGHLDRDYKQHSSEYPKKATAFAILLSLSDTRAA